MLLACENLTKRYGAREALRGLSVSVESGVVGLLGPNGAGKSTLISVLLGQTPPTSGRAYVLDLEVGRETRAIRQRVGYMPENDCLIPGLTGTGYVYYCGRLAGLGHGDAMQRAHQVLDYVDLHEARYRSAEQYSTGMKQRLKLAQALVHDPDLLLLDEPTNGMDPHGRQVMLELIRDLGRAGISVLLSSHLLPDVERVCDDVVIMAGGEVLLSGAIGELNRPHPTRCTVEVFGGAEALARALHGRVAHVEQLAVDRLLVELPGPDRQGELFEAARAANTVIRALSPQRSSLEEMFMAALERQRRSAA